MEMAVLQAVIVSHQLYHAPGRSWESPSLRTAAAGDGIGCDGMDKASKQKAHSAMRTQAGPCWLIASGAAGTGTGPRS